MVNLIIDSSIYLKDPLFQRYSATAVSKYCQLGIVRLFVPYVIEREFISHVTGDVRRIESETISAMAKLRRFMHKDDAIFGFDITGMFQKDEVERTIRGIQNNWDSFKRMSGAFMVAIGPKHGQSVMDAYFGGDPPFERAKNRNDIPDAFIYAAIMDVLEEARGVHFVSADERLRKKCETLEGLTGHSTLDEFLGCAEMQQLIISASTGDRMHRMPELLKFFEEAIKYHSSARLMVAIAASEEISGDLIEPHMVEPEVSLPTPSDISLDYGKVVVYSEEDSSVYFKGRFRLKISYKMEPQDLTKLDKDRVGAFSAFEETPDGYYVEESVDRQVQGVLSVHIPLGRIDQLKSESIGVTVEEVY